MKKVITVAVAAAVLIIAMTTLAYGADAVETPQWFKDMMSWKQDRIEEAVEDGTITKEQAEDWSQRLEDMEEWHEENGFQFGSGCGGFGGPGLNGQGFRGGYGRGMMRGYNWSNQNQL